MSPEDHCSVAALTGAQSRRTALHTGGALLAGMGALALLAGGALPPRPPQPLMRGEVAAPGPELQPRHALPNAGRRGEAHRTRVILWDAADRGFFFADWTSGVAGVVPSERVLAGIGTDAPARAVLVGASTEGDDSATPAQGVWALSLVYGDLGSDPGAVTYQGEPLASEDATSWLGTAPAATARGSAGAWPGIPHHRRSVRIRQGSEGVRLNLT